MQKIPITEFCLMLISSDDNHTSCLWVLSHLQNERETERKEKSQLLEHRCTVMVRSGCWSACLNSEGSHHGRSRGLPRHRVHWFPSQGPMSAWLITRTTCRYSVTCLLPVWQNPRHVGTHRPAASYEPTRWMWAEPAWLLHYVLVHLPFWAVLFVWC